MKRLFTALGIAAILALGWASLTRAAQPFPQTGRVLITSQGDITIPAGDRADAVVVVSGHAQIEGEVKTIVVIDGTANIVGAKAESVVAIGSQVEIGPGTTISDQVMRLDSTVHQSGNPVIGGGITDLGATLMGAGAVLAPALFLLWLGFGLASIIAALLVAGLAGRQLRTAVRLLAGDPVQAFLVGLGAVVLLPILAIVLMVTVIGAPLGVGILIGAMPLLAFAGYLVAATWIGDWLVRHTTVARNEEADRPFLSIVAGVLVLSAIGLIPLLGIVTAITSLLGFGAVIRFAFRTFRGAARPIAGAPRPLSAPTGA